MADQGQFILLITKMDDAKTRYITAKKLAQLFRNVPFAEWKSRLDSGNTVVFRSESMAAIDSYKDSLELVGATVEVVAQKSIGGAKVF